MPSARRGTCLAPMGARRLAILAGDAASLAESLDILADLTLADPALLRKAILSQASKARAIADNLGWRE